MILFSFSFDVLVCLFCVCGLLGSVNTIAPLIDIVKHYFAFFKNYFFLSFWTGKTEKDFFLFPYIEETQTKNMLRSPLGAAFFRVKKSQKPRKIKAFRRFESPPVFR